jgi:hypothetical protein
MGYQESHLLMVLQEIWRGYEHMKYLKWLAVLLLAGLLGILFVQYLSVHPLQMSLYLVATLVVLFLLIIVFGIGFQRTSLLFAVLLSLGAFVIGHVAMTKVILARDDPRPVPELTRVPGDQGLGHICHFQQ